MMDDNKDPSVTAMLATYLDSTAWSGHHRMESNLGPAITIVETRYSLLKILTCPDFHDFLFRDSSSPVGPQPDKELGYMAIG